MTDNHDRRRAPGAGSRYDGIGAIRPPARSTASGANNACAVRDDDTIDPAETRRWVASLLHSIRPPASREGKKRPATDAW